MSKSIRITLNGHERTVAEGTTVQALLAELGLSSAPCAVEVDGHLVPGARASASELRDGAAVEVVTLVGGG